jgi:hypothetical protein
MTTSTTTAAALELSAMIYSTPAVPESRPSGAAALAIKVGVAGLAIWLIATLGVLTGRWRPPVPVEIAEGPSPVVMTHGDSAR